MTEEEILDTLDNCHDGYYCSFVDLGHAYSYLIDARLNVFSDQNKRWAIAVERLGYNPRAQAIILDINYFGNCLTNLAFCNERPTSVYYIYPIDAENFNKTIEHECLKKDAKYWLVRGQQVLLSHNKQDYIDAGIDLKECEPDEISAEEAGRLVILHYRELFRAREVELYKSIPTDLRRILVLDGWFHKDFNLQIVPIMTDEHLDQTYSFNKNLTGLGGLSFEGFSQLHRHQQILNNEWNNEMWQHNRPSSYETWQLIAKVIVMNDASQYKPTLEPNTHWANWPESGNL